MIYLSGKINNMPQMNRPAFEKYEKKLVEIGHKVFNPLTVSDDNPNLKEIEYMGIDLMALSRCDAVYLIPGWENSKGARIEVFFALSYGVPCYSAETLDLISWTDIDMNVTLKSN